MKSGFALMVLVLATAGLVSAMLLPLEFFWIGGTLFSSALALGATVRQRGPLRQATLDEPEDERERGWRERANADAFGVVAVLAMLGIGGYGFWMLLALLAGRGTPAAAPVILIAFAMFLFVLFLVLPTLFAIGNLPSAIEDEPEDRLSFLKARRPRL